ncbi:50S ribosomal protein L10 [Sphingobacterium spiritivorum]|uniref:Large ribosomal subunit protein uL10 n=1 Tax=Sphingobacterium spiritivorum ATCC 33861 TaxID=525373 RepID=D7VMT3_SPHSI|nr:50S ribosomal protein L10 [Sphingobacterium spiritivorum]EFK57230.1 ribosomal protein L10 [Sphingobacterium spiritivorum ATCC 33861]QQT36683.1 50S ribosomal protein L10 [Sphingobacterium spiritivorum]WQD33435.1 50S ribosomal protein L10 [Sphingobacterium spiritivorum]SUJ23418.1 50S ribosomal protein L10 [Sphingobacterium spiritivorum]
MRKEEKQEIVLALAEQIKSYGNFYIADTADLSVEKVNGIRRKCFESGIEIKVVKNSLIKKALIEAGVDSEEIFGTLKGASTLMFSEVGNAPAKLIKQLRKEGDKPLLKAAYIDSAAFVGDGQLNALVNLKSKNELIADVIALLESPAKNVISALQSGGNTISGLVKALEERG